jgi:hypothetical protein
MPLLWYDPIIAKERIFVAFGHTFLDFLFYSRALICSSLCNEPNFLDNIFSVTRFVAEGEFIFALPAYMPKEPKS